MLQKVLSLLLLLSIATADVLSANANPHDITSIINKSVPRVGWSSRTLAAAPRQSPLVAGLVSKMRGGALNFSA
jgi:hypothetical protein